MSEIETATTFSPALSIAADASAIAGVLERLRQTAPLIHASMNTVAQAFVANALTALGADVSMTSAADEVGEMVERADALLINLGTLDPARCDGITAAVTAAGRAGMPFVLDPVKVDRAPRRLALAEHLIGKGPAIVKGNVAEMAALSPADGAAAMVTTGVADTVVHGDRRAVVANGTPLLARVIATGCALGGVIAAARAVEPDPFLASLGGLAIWSVAAEQAAEGAAGPGTFAARLLDCLATLTPEALANAVRLSDG